MNKYKQPTLDVIEMEIFCMCASNENENVNWGEDLWNE